MILFEVFVQRVVFTYKMEKDEYKSFKMFTRMWNIIHVLS